MTMTTSSPASGARLLSNGRFSTLITAAGSGYCELGDCALTRWQGDPVEDGDAYLVYLRDADSGEFWTLGAQFAHAGAGYASGHSEAGAWLSCIHDGIEARLDVVVGADEDVELRTVSLRNVSGRARRIDVTSYLEVVLNVRAAEASHPAFSKLFVQMEAVGDALLARRRPRGAGEDSVWMVHAAHGGSGAEFETDRKRFVGRGASLAAPLAMTSGVALSGTAGNVLDPAMSLRRGVALDDGGSATIVFMLGAAADRDAALALARHAGSAGEITRGAAARQQAILQQLGVTSEQAACYEELAVAMLYGDTALRAGAEVQRRVSGSAGVLAEYEIPSTGALCVAVSSGPNDASVTTLLAAARYWQALWQPIHLLIIGDDWKAPAANVSLLDPARVPGADLDAILCLARAVVDGALPKFGPRQPRRATAPTCVPEAPDTT